MSNRLSNYPLTIDSQGLLTNPTTATVVADTGALTSDLGGSGTYEVLVTFSTSATAIFQVEHRNIANSANVDDVQIFQVAANTVVAIPLRFFLKVDATGGERVRVMMQTNLTGNASASITVQRVA
jgi:hypothetical protein